MAIKLFKSYPGLKRHPYWGTGSGAGAILRQHHKDGRGQDTAPHEVPRRQRTRGRSQRRKMAPFRTQIRNPLALGGFFTEREYTLMHLPRTNNSYVTRSAPQPIVSPSLCSHNFTRPAKCQVSLREFALVILLSLFAAHDSFSQEASSGWIYQECDSISELHLRDQLYAITQSVLENERNKIDISVIIEREWLHAGVDNTLDKEIDAAVESVSKEENILERIKSGWSSDTALYMAERVLSTLSLSPEFQDAMDHLMEQVVAAIDVELEQMIVNSGSSALLCVQAYIDANLSEAMVVAFQDALLQIRPGLSPGKIRIRTDVGLNIPTTLSLPAALAVALGNITAKVTTIIAKRITTGVLSRVVGVAGGTVLPFVGWVTVIAATVTDIIMSVRGAFPKIKKELKSPATKTLMREQIEVAVRDELRKSLPEAGRTVSNYVFGKWQAFRREYAEVIRLSENNSRFATILNNTTKDELHKLSRLVAKIDEYQTSKEIKSLIETGNLERILALPEESLEILGATRDPSQIIMWANLSGNRLPSVIETELYKLTTPDQFADRDELDMALTIGDPNAIRKAMSLGRTQRSVLFRLPTDISRFVINELSPEEISWLVSQIMELSVGEVYRLSDCVLRHRELRTELSLRPVDGLIDRIKRALGPKRLQKCVS